MPAQIAKTLRIRLARAHFEVQNGRLHVNPHATQDRAEEERKREKPYISVDSIAAVPCTTRSHLYSSGNPGYSQLMAPLVLGVESRGTIESPGEFAASGQSLQACNRGPARSQSALFRSTARRRSPARNQQRRFCRPAVGGVSVKSMFLKLEEDHDIKPLAHSLDVHLRTYTASSELFRCLSEDHGNTQDIWRTHAAVINRENSDASVCPTTQAQASNSDSANPEPTYAELNSTPSLGSPSPNPSQTTPDTCVMPFDPHTPDTTLRFEDFVNFTPTGLQPR